MPDSSDPAQRATALLDRISGTPFGERFRLQDEIAAELRSIADADPVAALEVLPRIMAFFTSQRTFQRNLRAFHREVLTGVPLDRIADLAEPVAPELAVVELVRRSEFERAQAVATAQRAEARTAGNWRVYVAITEAEAAKLVRAQGPAAVMKFYAAALQEIPGVAREARGSLVRRMTDYAIGASTEASIIPVLGGYLDSLKSKPAELVQALSEALLSAGRRALDAGDLSAASEYFNDLLARGRDTEQLTGLFLWADALSARGDYVSLRAHFERRLRFGSREPHIVRSLRERIGLADFALGNPGDALRQFRSAYAKLSVLDNASHEALSVYAVLLAQDGDFEGSRWAADRAAREAPRPPGRSLERR